MASTYPNGYGNQLLGLAALRERHAAKMHPEYARRLFACLEAADGLVGIGGGWRSTQMQAESYARAPNTFAPPGLSFHESHRFSSGVEAFAAVDTVGRDGRHDEAWNWMRDNAGQFGLRTFWNVNGEPWHVQFSDLPNGVSTWKAQGCPDPGSYTLPDGSVAPPRPDYAPHPTNDDKPVLRVGWHGDLVRYVQQVIADEAGGRIAVDGDFGPQTESRVKDVQYVAELPPTGVIDWNGTWQMLDHLAGHERSAPARSGSGSGSGGDGGGRGGGRAGAVVDVEAGYYWIQRGDSPWSVAERVYGSGHRHDVFEPCEPSVPGFQAADHHIRLPDVAGRTTVVVPGDHARSIVARLYPDRDPAALVRRFHELNGGPHRMLHPGDLVFVDLA